MTALQQHSEGHFVIAIERLCHPMDENQLNYLDTTAEIDDDKETTEARPRACDKLLRATRERDNEISPRSETFYPTHFVNNFSMGRPAGKRRTK
jgi:hypothetical protein